jgi:cyclophilin family peptidyl-prolyl cis-trans isomerase
VVLPGAGASITGETPCPPVDGSAERTTSFENPPPLCLDPTKTYTATLKTTEGDIVIDLDTAKAPFTVNNFMVLARYHFYDNVPFHRVVPGFVNQAGDPVGPEPGTGGPGYAIPDELPADPATAYPAGTVAMATSGPESGGSQFFLVIGDPNGALSGSGSYSVFGKIVAGQDVSEAINALAGPNDVPTKPVTITTVEITET